MKRYLQLFFLVVMMPLILGMGSLNEGSSPDKIPIPEKKYKVTFIDQMDVLTECSNASIDGRTFMEGKIGSGSHAISFDKINHILFHMIDDKLIAALKLTEGSKIELTVNKSAKAFGITSHGTFQIKLIDLKRMIIEGPIK